MKQLIIGLVLLPFFAFTVVHKFYVSVTQINYIEDKQSVQITSRIFIDDMENVLRDRYDESLTLAGKDEPKTVDDFIEKYLKEKFLIKINGENVQAHFLGKEYDADIMRCYLEVESVKSIKAFEVSNQVLLDFYEDQQNIIKTNIYSKQKSAVLSKKNHSLMLKFN
ncbi:DUF6702 family protein [Aestuariivivens insulae]|uniref:DUF6702 family protein n=1 Tax=Aestuariivivens insulae TaxID=1621988 RepID=UPI001F58B7F9|nr:DUF6702 family protein [Aestuariivivens insulae]